MKNSKISILIVLIGLILTSCSSSPDNQSQTQRDFYKPWIELEELFHDVQIAGVYPDSKTFVDCTPKRNPKAILMDYRSVKMNEDFDLVQFVRANFNDPVSPQLGELAKQEIDASVCVGCSDSGDSVISQHLYYLWDHLTRPAKSPSDWSTLISLQNQYVVPGGRFREIYYWDSYFTMIGLGVSGRTDLIKSMIDNFAYLVDTVGFIPNGNRTYYLGRSQPPFFASMVNLYAQLTSREAASSYLPAVQKEYDFWMAGADQLSSENPAINHVVMLDDGTVLNRYWDKLDSPRPESYKEDYELAEEFPEPKKKPLYKNLRAGAASGWDYSTRWFQNKEEFTSIRTVEILPVDLNCLMYAMESVLADLYDEVGDSDLTELYQDKAETRKRAIQAVFWDEEKGAFTDYVWTENQLSEQLTLAGNFALYFNIATDKQAKLQAKTIEREFLRPGGVVTTTIASGQQWDAPNGWAPLQWVTVKGLEHYDEDELAASISNRWVKINKKVFKNTGRMMEKYNVVDTTLLAGGGEYPTQDGFGWTNGVLLGLIADDPIY
ncbi:MAG: alpha,alpha-trehalase TreF [Cyclobacteriaceae bacterium]